MILSLILKVNSPRTVQQLCISMTGSKNSEKSTGLWCSLTIFIAIWTDFDHFSDLFVEYLFIYSVWRALRDIAYFNDNEKFIQTI